MLLIVSPKEPIGDRVPTVAWSTLVSRFPSNQPEANMFGCQVPWKPDWDSGGLWAGVGFLWEAPNASFCTDLLKDKNFPLGAGSVYFQ